MKESHSIHRPACPGSPEAAHLISIQMCPCGQRDRRLALESPLLADIFGSHFVSLRRVSTSHYFDPWHQKRVTRLLCRETDFPAWRLTWIIPLYTVGPMSPHKSHARQAGARELLVERMENV